jgi:hypothetical protein
MRAIDINAIDISAAAPHASGVTMACVHRLETR